MALRHLMLSAVAVVGLCGALGLSGCESVESRMARTYTGDLDILSLQHAGLRPRWTHTVGLAPNEKLKNVWRVGDAIYAATSQGHLVSVSASAGTRNWDVDIGVTAHDIFRPALSTDGKDVIIINQGKVMAVNKLTGGIVATRDLGFFATTDPYIMDNVLCVGSSHHFYGLFLDPLGGKKWNIPAAQDYFVARPAPVGPNGTALIVAGAETGLLWRLQVADGDPVWRDRKVNGHVTAGLASDLRNVYVACMDGRVYAFDQNNGGSLWDTLLEGKLNLAPVSASAATLLVPTTGGGLYALSTEKGDIKWRLPDISKIGTVTGDKFYAGDKDGNLLCILVDTGEILSKVKFPGLANVLPNRTDNLVYVELKDGRIVALEPSK